MSDQQTEGFFVVEWHQRKGEDRYRNTSEHRHVALAVADLHKVLLYPDTAFASLTGPWTIENLMENRRSMSGEEALNG